MENTSGLGLDPSVFLLQHTQLCLLVVFLWLSFKNSFPHNFHFSAFSLKLPLHEVSLCFTSKSFPLLFASVGRVQDRPVCSLTDSVSQHGRSQCVPGTVLLSTEQMRLFLELHKDSNKLKYKKEESRPRGTRLPPHFP